VNISLKDAKKTLRNIDFANFLTRESPASQR
jgi:hypothetical protein